MNNIGDTLSQKKQLLTTPTEINKLKPTDNCSVDTTGKRVNDADHLFEYLIEQGLVNQQFKAWYCKMFYKLGKDKVLQLAGRAKVDSNTQPAKLFSYLLKKATS